MTDTPSAAAISTLRVAFMSAIIAKSQAGYLKTLMEQGIPQDVALQLTESTTAKILDIGTDILDDITELVKVIGQNAPAIAEAVQSTIFFISETEQQR